MIISKGIAILESCILRMKPTLLTNVFEGYMLLKLEDLHMNRSILDFALVRPQALSFDSCMHPSSHVKAPAMTRTGHNVVFKSSL